MRAADGAAAPGLLLVCLDGSPAPAQRALVDEGLWVTTCHQLAEAIWRLRSLRPELVLLQVGGRDADDWARCRRVADAADQPLFVLVDDPSVDARLAALAAGADDVLGLPFHPLELVARARALLRRPPVRAEGPAVLRHRDLELDLDGHLASLGGRPLALSPLEFRLLRTLLESPQRTFSRDELLTRVHVFDDRMPTERSIDLHVTELRQKLGDQARRPAYVETVRGIGYRLARQAPSGDLGASSERRADGHNPNGAGSQLEAAVTRALTGAGAAVVVAAPSATEAEALAAELRRAGHRAEAMST